MRLGLFLPTVGIACIVAKCPAQTNVFQGVRMAHPPKIDGVIEPGEWGGIPSADHFSDQLTGRPEEESTTFWLAYDDRYVYFAARMEDHNPATIRAIQYRTNVSLTGDDQIQLDLDPFGRTEGYSQFAINPRGATSLYIAGGRAAKREWLGEFAAAARITATGWEAEARIPWGIMRLPPPGKRECSFNVMRTVPRESSSYVWRYSPTTSENYGRWMGVEIPKSGNKRRLLLLPYAFAGADARTGRIIDGGLDLKTSLSDRLDLVGSINPDFRNIEDAILSLDFSYFARLNGERRPFFLEGSDFFMTSLDAPLFTPQAIQRFDAGMKTFGALNDKLQLGLMDTDLIGKENDAVTNVRYQPDPATTYTACYVGYRAPGLQNNGSFIGWNKSFGAYDAYLQDENTQDSAVGFGHRYNAGMFYFRNGLNVQAEYLEISPNFLPRLGFAPEVDTRGAFIFSDWDRKFRQGFLAENEWSARIDEYHHLSNGLEFHGERLIFGDFALRNGVDANLSARAQTFEGFHDHTYQLSLLYPRSNPFNSVQIAYVFGDIEQTYYQSATGSLFWRPIRPLQLSFTIQGVRHGDTQDQTVLGFSWDLGHDLSLNGRAVQTGHNTNAYLALNRSGNRGAEYYLIFGDPNALQFQRSLVLKVVVPFSLKF